MFGKKKIENLIPEIKIAVDTMPADFYGGANPVVKFKNVNKEVVVGQRVATPVEKSLLSKATVAGAKEKFHPANLLTNKRFLIIGSSVMFVVFLVGASWYYGRDYFVNRPTPTLPGPAVTTVIEQPAVIETIPIVETTTTEQTVTKQFSAEAPIELPSILLGDSTDMDKDGVSDLAEELFATDPALSDTDGDKFTDSQEINNLYNPAGIAPMKIIDSGLAQEFSNPVFKYQLYYPQNWSVGNIDPDYRDVLFTTMNGENVEVRVFDLVPGQTWPDWFAKFAPNEKFADLKEFTTTSKKPGWQRNDGLVYYFIDANRVYVIVYHVTDLNIVNYRIVIKMMARSFVLPGSLLTLPVLPVEGSTTMPVVTSTNLITVTNTVNIEPVL